MEDFGQVPLLSRVHPDLKDAQMKVVRHFQQAYNVPVQKVDTSKLNKNFPQKALKFNQRNIGTIFQILPRHGNLVC